MTVRLCFWNSKRVRKFTVLSSGTSHELLEMTYETLDFLDLPRNHHVSGGLYLTRSERTYGTGVLVLSAPLGHLFLTIQLEEFLPSVREQGAAEGHSIRTFATEP